MNQDKELVDWLPNGQERKSISVDFKLLKVVLLNHGEDLFVSFLDLFDVRVLLNAFLILLFPVTHLLKFSLFELFEPETFLVISGVKGCLWILLQIEVLVVRRPILNQVSWLCYLRNELNEGLSRISIAFRKFCPFLHHALAQAQRPVSNRFISCVWAELRRIQA